MKAMILAAGRGERMRPLTDTVPKPLLNVAGKPLIVYHLEKLASVGIVDVVVNIAYLGEQIQQCLGSGSQWGLSIEYSEEPEPLETGGALLQALPLLGSRPFLLINADIWCDNDFTQLMQLPLQKNMAQLVLVKNPDHNLEGDFSVINHQLATTKPDEASYTYSGLALVDPRMIIEYPEKRRIFPLREVFNYYLQQQQLGAVLDSSVWWDIGTPERLAALESYCFQASGIHSK